jgi:hypothetical protein
MLTYYEKLKLMFLALFVFGVGMTSVGKSSGLIESDVRHLENQLGGAIFLHIISATVLGVLTQWCSPWKFWRLPMDISILVPILMLLVASDELLQNWLPNRHFEWTDLLVNVSCVFFGALFVTRIYQPNS